MALKTYPVEAQFKPVETLVHLVTAAEATAEAVEVVMNRPVTGVIAQIRTVTTGVVYATGLEIDIETVANKSCKITVKGTDLTEGNIITLIAF
jgi:hypothetical protein